VVLYFSNTTDEYFVFHFIEDTIEVDSVNPNAQVVWCKSFKN